MNLLRANLNTENIEKIGLVVSRFNEPITKLLQQGAFEQIAELGIAEERVIAVSVPGAVEIPLAAQVLLDQGCEGVVCLGAVIRGETSHYDYVCSSVESGCTRLALDYKRPVIFGVLTTENKDQALARCGGKKGHKGKEAVDTLIEMVNLIDQLTK